MCGKNPHNRACRVSRSGSPPRVREKLAFSIPEPYAFRITPACAGKTLALVPLLQKCQDHPRVCGKNSNVIPPWHSISGSPPRVREKRKKSKAYRDNHRITPACAGKTLSCFRFDLRTRDHPRVCGKNFVVFGEL